MNSAISYDQLLLQEVDYYLEIINNNISDKSNVKTLLSDGELRIYLTDNISDIVINILEKCYRSKGWDIEFTRKDTAPLKIAAVIKKHGA